MVRTLTMCVVLAAPLVGAAQGKLDAVRDAVDKPRTSDDSRSNSDSADSVPAPDPGDPEEPDPLKTEFQSIFLQAAGWPWVAPHMLLDPGLDVNARFAHYPFAAPDTGYMVLNRKHAAANGRPRFFERTDMNWYSVRTSAEIGSDFDGLTRVGLRLFLDTDTRFGLTTNWDYFSEKRACGCRDELWLGDVTATFRFVQTERLMMHTGAGARFLLDHGEDRGGVNFLYGFDAFPTEPVHLFGSVEAGTLGAAGVLRLRGGIGINWTHAEFFAGYDYINIGGAVLQGPFVGLRLWF
jgi:hypothetical protein